MCATFLYIWALCLRNAWLDSGYTFCPSYCFFEVFPEVKADSDSEDDAVLFSCVVVVNGSGMCYSGFAGMMHLVLCPRRMVLALVIDNGSGSILLVLLVFLHLALCFRRFSACWHVGTLGGRSLPLVV